MSWVINVKSKSIDLLFSMLPSIVNNYILAFFPSNIFEEEKAKI